MNTIHFSEETLQRLQKHATAEACSVDEMLNRLINDRDQANTPPSINPTDNDVQHIHEILETIIHHIPVMIGFFDENGRFEFVNQCWLDRVGWTVEELRATSEPLMLFYPDEVYRQNVLDFMLSGQIGWREFESHTKFNGILHTAWTNVRLSDGRSIGIGRDVTAEKKIENVALENARLKERFRKEQEQNALVQRVISALSHDLRIPLSVIATSKEILRHYFDQISPEKRMEKLDNIGRQLGYAINLLDDTVEVIRGNINEPFIATLVYMPTLCQVSVEEISATAKYSHNMYFVNLSDIGEVNVGEVLVSRILMNLLSNAVKYSPRGSAIRLELDKDGDNMILRVIDEGMGISEEDLKHVFEPFYRVDEVRTIHGTGLGLSIVKDCVERHHGSISVQSTRGKGSTFTVTLPISS